MDGQEQDDVVGQCVKQTTGIEQLRHVDAFARDALIEDLCLRRALEDFHKAGDAVEEDHHHNQRHDNDVERTPSPS